MASLLLFTLIYCAPTVGVSIEEFGIVTWLHMWLHKPAITVWAGEFMWVWLLELLEVWVEESLLAAIPRRPRVISPQ